MQEYTNRPCPICGCFESDIVHHYKGEFNYFSKLPQEYDIVACKECGFVYSDIAASQSIYDEYYSQFSAYDNLGITYGADDNSKEVYRQRAREIASFLSKDASILEIGSANGLLLKELKELGFQNLSALDLSTNALDGLAKKGIKTHLGGIFSSDNSNEIHKPLREQFDCVCLTQVLEHIYDVQGAMQNMKRMVKQGGYLYIETPDAGHFCDFCNTPIEFFHFEHINYFDKASMINLANSNGVQMVEIIQKNVHFNTCSNVYPCVVGIFQKPCLAKSNCSSSIKEYDEKHQHQYNNIISLFENSDEEFALWGIGTFAQELLKKAAGKWNIKYLVDSNPLHEGKQLFNHRINLPEKLLTAHFDGTILITTALYADEVVDQIHQIGLNCKYIKL